MIRSRRSKNWMSASEAMEALHVSKWALSRMRKNNVVKFRKINARVFLYSRRDIAHMCVDF